MTVKFDFPEAEADPGKVARVAAYYELLKKGIEPDAMMLHRRFTVSMDQMQCDINDAVAKWHVDTMAFGSKDLSVKEHIRERIDIGQLAKRNGELGTALDAIKDVAKLQNLYDETQHVDNKVTFEFKYSIPEIAKQVVDVKEIKDEVDTKA